MEFYHTPDKLKEVAADAIRLARQNGADAAEADTSESVSMEVEVRGGVLDAMNMNRAQGLSLTVYLGAREGSASAGELSPATIRATVDKAISIARASAADPCCGLADKEMMATEFADLSLYHPWPISPTDAIAMAQQCEEAAWDAHAAINRQKSESALSTGQAQSAYANSHGFCHAEAETFHSLNCAAIAEQNGQMERDGWGETRRCADDIPSAADIGGKSGRRAARRLGGKKIIARRANVLFQAPVSHSLIHHFLAAASGGALYRKTSWLLDKLDCPIFAPHLNIWELPHLPGEMRSANYDDEGVATRERAVIDNGIWRGCFLSAYTARRLQMQTTGNAGGAHNLEVGGDMMSDQEILDALGDGLIITDLMGQGVNGVTGDYSRGAAGFWVEKGEIIHPVNEATIAGNLLEMLPAIIAIGKDAMRHGLVRCGSILIPNIMIGGGK